MGPSNPQRPQLPSMAPNGPDGPHGPLTAPVYVKIVHYVKKSFIYKIKIFASYFIINENIKKIINC